MIRSKRWAGILGVAAALAAVGTESAPAQVFTPTFMPPRVSSDIGVYLSDDLGDFAVEGILRRNFGGPNLGLRVGLADGPGDAVLLLGGELRSGLMGGTDPIDLAITGGAQGVLGDGEDLLGLQVGVSLGHTFASPGLNITPYLHPRLAFLSDYGPFDSDIDLLADLGVDVDFSPRLSLRFAAVLAEADQRPHADWGIGLAWR